MKELDTKTLTAALVKQKAQSDADHEIETDILRYMAAHPVVSSPVCGLDADGLRLWNSENRGVEVQ